MRIFEICAQQGTVNTFLESSFNLSNELHTGHTICLFRVPESLSRANDHLPRSFVLVTQVELGLTREIFTLNITVVADDPDKCVTAANLMACGRRIARGYGIETLPYNL